MKKDAAPNIPLKGRQIFNQVTTFIVHLGGYIGMLLLISHSFNSTHKNPSRYARRKEWGKNKTSQIASGFVPDFAEPIKQNRMNSNSILRIL